MNYKKETLELLGYEHVESMIPQTLLNNFADYFTI
jgi:hypothetical protein